MRALQLPSLGAVAVTDVPDPAAQPGEAVVRVRAAALNHRDVWIKQGKYAGLRFPCIPGSDGCGVVESVGSGVDTSWVGREVVIDPGSDWGPTERAQSAAYTILGLPRDGTLAERVAVPASQLSPKPAHLDAVQAAALPLAGLTAYRAVASRAQVAAGERVLVTGIGGGVALFALQFAVALGARVWVTSSSEEKLRRARESGAEGGFLYTADGWAKDALKASGGFDVIVDSAGGDGFGALLDAAAPGGRIVFFGATRGDPPAMPMRKAFWRQLSLLGSTMGSPKDWAAMLALVDAHGIVSVVSAVHPLADGARAFEEIEQGAQFGKIVVTMS